MATFKCKICGGNLTFEKGSNVTTCEFCCSQQTLPTEIEPAHKIDKLLNFENSDESKLKKITNIKTPYNGEKKYIFISYCHRNSESVLEVIKLLQADGYRVWYDEGIDPGTEWDEYIAEKIEKSGYFIAFISEEYIQSDNCKDELKYARDLKKDRLLIYLTNVELTGGLAMRLNRLQAIHKYKYPSLEAFFEKLKTTPALDTYIDEDRE